MKRPFTLVTEEEQQHEHTAAGSSVLDQFGCEAAGFPFHGHVSPQRRSLRLEQVFQLLEEERKKKQRLEWYLQEVLLEREALTTGNSNCNNSSAVPRSSYPDERDTSDNLWLDEQPLSDSSTSLVTFLLPPPQSLGTCEACGHATCRCSSFESVRKRQRRLSCFMKTGKLEGDEDQAPLRTRNSKQLTPLPSKQQQQQHGTSEGTKVEEGEFSRAKRKNREGPGQCQLFLTNQSTGCRARLRGPHLAKGLFL